MSNLCRAALAAAFLLSGCGGGGGDPAPTPPATTTPAEALRLTAQATMDVTAMVWSLAADVQNTLVTAPSETERTLACSGGGRTLVTRPAADLLRIQHEACVISGLAFNGRIEAEGATVTRDSAGTAWSGTVRMVDYGIRSEGSSPRSQMLSVVATGSGRVASLSQPLALQLSGLTVRRSPTALGRDATLSSASLQVERIPSGVIRDLYGLAGCVAFAAQGLAAELCLDPGSRIGLVENVGGEQLTGRLRWNAGQPGGFDARLRITPGGGPGTFALRVELDLDNNGSFEASALLDRSTDIGLRL